MIFALVPVYGWEVKRYTRLLLLLLRLRPLIQLGSLLASKKLATSCKLIHRFTNSPSQTNGRWCGGSPPFVILSTVILPPDIVYETIF